MMTIVIGAGVSGFVLGATSRMVFLLPAALMALVVAGELIVRADIDLGFTALAASLLNGGFLLGVVMAPVMSRLLVSPRWAVDETDAGFVGIAPVRGIGTPPNLGAITDWPPCSPKLTRARARPF